MLTNNKPFKPPSLADPLLLGRASSLVPPAKKRRISRIHDNISTASPAVRSPLVDIVNLAPTDATSNSQLRNSAGACYTVLWRAPTTKKHKTWDGDGMLYLSHGCAHFLDSAGRLMGKAMWERPLNPGSMLCIGGKELEVSDVIDSQDFFTSSPLLSPTTASTNAVPVRAIKNHGNAANKANQEIRATDPTSTQNRAVNTRFKSPLMLPSVISRPLDYITPKPLHDPDAPHALVMRRPSATQIPKGKKIVDVVVDPLLAKHLRDHQRQGVQFLYNCVTGLGLCNGRGAILADEMGLGKTLQTITLLWTLLKQSFIYADPPIVKKAIIVCPAGVVGNWRKEIIKWLGKERLGVFVADEMKQLTSFTRGKCYNVMLIGYERLVRSQDQIKEQCKVDLIVLDEGHKLKATKGKTAQAIRALGTDRIVMLSGTPFSNNMLEFHAVADLVNPGVFQNLNAFRRHFADPIVRGQQPDATNEERKKGSARYEEFYGVSKEFMIRRTTDILARYLPPKTENVLLCRPTETQVSIYRSVLALPAVTGSLESTENALQIINVLKKLCNSPELLSSPTNGTPPTATMAAIREAVPHRLIKTRASAKLHVLDGLLHQIRTSTNEKVVIISHYTSTLDILEALLRSLDYSLIRVDGSTPAIKRQEKINAFNKSDADTCFAFLLSAKAGGVGINLIGASRLVLYDIDWNPAHDLQAMARIHRDGQQRACKIYRLLTMGALDEKIYQRQVTKQSLADSIIDNKASSLTFTKEELRDLFTLNEGDCQTHRLIGCACGGDGTTSGLLTANSNCAVAEAIDQNESSILACASVPDIPEQDNQLKEANTLKDDRNHLASLMQYTHIDTDLITGMGVEQSAHFDALLDDKPLMEVIKEDGSRVKFVFARTSSTQIGPASL